MTPTEAIQALRQYSKWRRSMTNCDDNVRQAIDTACDSLEESLQFVATLGRDLARIKTAIKLGGFDLAQCMICEMVIVAIPDGLYMCAECAAKEG